jgi:hypothetical protein
MGFSRGRRDPPAATQKQAALGYPCAGCATYSRQGRGVKPKRPEKQPIISDSALAFVSGSIPMKQKGSGTVGPARSTSERGNDG